MWCHAHARACTHTHTSKIQTRTPVFLFKQPPELFFLGGIKDLYLTQEGVTVTHTHTHTIGSKKKGKSQQVNSVH